MEKPLTILGILVGLAGLGVGAYAIFRRQGLPVPPAAQPGLQPPGAYVQYTNPIPGGTTSAQLPPGVAPTGGAGTVGNVVGTVVGTVGAVAGQVAGLIDFFSNLGS